MDMAQESIVEAALLIAKEPVTLDMIADMLEVTAAEAEQIVHQLRNFYESNQRGIQIVSIADGYQICTRPEVYPYLARIQKLAKKPSLSGAMMEVLSIVAYKQPVTKGEIHAIRGVVSDKAVNRLIEYGLIQEAGRQETPGRPILLQTTDEFLRHFGINSLDQLPKLSEKEGI